MPSLRPLVWALASALFVLSLCPLAVRSDSAAQDMPAPLMSDGKTVLGQPFAYPEGDPNITTTIATLQPREVTPWHQHDVPMVGYILEGEIVVDYGAMGKRLYRKGDVVIEAIGIPHRGRNTGSVPARILSVFVGAKGVPNTTVLPGYFPQ